MYLRGFYIQEIASRLAWIKAQVEVLDSLNLYDINIHSEAFFCGLLNVIFGYNLKNINDSEKNFPSIDLEDKFNRVAIQVTTQEASSKIQYTLDKFFENKLDKTFDRLIVLIIGTKLHYTKTFKVKEGFSFSRENDIWDTSFLIQEIKKKETAELEKVFDYLSEELTPANGYTGFSPAKVAQDMYNKAHALCTVKLHAAGIQEYIAARIIDADIATSKYQYILDSAFSGKRYLTGDFGAGKSHALTILAQQLANNYLDNTNNPLPLFIQAKELSRIGSVQQWIDSLNIGSLSYILLIDGLDEVDVKFATQIIEDIDILAISNPQSKIVVSSRPLFAISKSGKTFEILPLTDKERNILYDSIVGDSSSNFAFHHLDPKMNSLLARPFFCIIYALFKSEPKSWAKTDMDLVSAFIKRTLQKVEDQSSVLTDLSAIAAKSISKNLGDVHLSEIRLTGTLDNLLKTGFISLTDEYLSFSLPIIGQWMAAEAIRRKIVQISSIIDDRANTTRWLYPFSILFSQMSFEESLEYFSQIVLKTPDIAARIIRDGIRFGTLRSAPTENECGKMIQQCMQFWIDAIGPLAPYIAPIEDGHLYPLGINIENGQMITYAWLKNYSGEFVVPMSQNELMQIPGCKAEDIPAQATWPWIITLDALSDRLEDVVHHRCMIVEHTQLCAEYVWNVALQMAGKGSAYVGELSFESCEKYRHYIGKPLQIETVFVQTDLFFKIIDEHLSSGISKISPPFPVSDRAQASGGDWMAYSTERYLEKIQFIYNSALTEYSTLVDAIFSSFKKGFRISQLSPCRLVGKLMFEENSEYAPSLTWYLEALPHSEQNSTDIQLTKTSVNPYTLLESIARNNSVLRPELVGSNIASVTSQLLYGLSTTPVTDVVYKWLNSELTAIGWLK